MKDEKVKYLQNIASLHLNEIKNEKQKFIKKMIIKEYIRKVSKVIDNDELENYLNIQFFDKDKELVLDCLREYRGCEYE